MIYISHIVKRWQENINDEPPSTENADEGNKQTSAFKDTARTLLKKASNAYSTTREDTRKKFSNLLSQLEEQKLPQKPALSLPTAEVEVQEKDAPVRQNFSELGNEEHEFRNLEKDLAEILEENQEQDTHTPPAEVWDEDGQDFTSGLFEDNADFTVDKRNVDEPDFVENVVDEKEDFTDEEPVKEQDRSRQSRSDEKTMNPKSPVDEGEHLNIENVLKSMKSKGIEQRSGKKRHGNPRKSDKKGSRHKWV